MFPINVWLWLPALMLPGPKPGARPRLSGENRGRYRPAPVRPSRSPLVARGMTNAFSSMEYPHWLIVAGAVLVMLGLVGLAVRRRGPEVELKDMATDQQPPEPEANLTQTQSSDREEKFQEQKRHRWADKDRGTKEPLNDRPKIYDEESK
jgi:hypothetical protein